MLRHVESKRGADRPQDGGTRRHKEKQMTVVDVITRIRSSMAEPAGSWSVRSSTPAGCIETLQSEDVMRRLISLFDEPDLRETGPPIGLGADSKEPIYFRHLMDYLRERNRQQRDERQDETIDQTARSN